ncbi:Uncharacterised protein [Serratia quinivorans]|jgi:hypothetical protein|uniref:Uncharacterized protein n=1 Tax=Serratia proteamaculans TaxID=28151 RepID=A0ABS0TYL5_SERPR|nr:MULTISPECIES: hypothetical protein [Serratia]MBI6183465.1 hypothetical protein [Serratia proteamaculans]CAI1511918.1 Uncharacterised protein [Serratia quinivorans]
MSLSDKDTFIQHRMQVIMARGFSREDAEYQASDEWRMEASRIKRSDYVKGQSLINRLSIGYVWIVKYFSVFLSSLLLLSALVAGIFSLTATDTTSGSAPYYAAGVAMGFFVLFILSCALLLLVRIEENTRK